MPIMSSIEPSGLPPNSALFPYTTLFRSGLRECHQSPGRLPEVGAVGPPGGEGPAAPGRADPALQPALPPEPGRREGPAQAARSEEHTSELQSRRDIVCRLLLDKKIDTHS